MTEIPHPLAPDNYDAMADRLIQLWGSQDGEKVDVVRVIQDVFRENPYVRETTVGIMLAYYLGKDQEDEDISIQGSEHLAQVGSLAATISNLLNRIVEGEDISQVAMPDGLKELTSPDALLDFVSQAQSDLNERMRNA